MKTFTVYDSSGTEFKVEVDLWGNRNINTGQTEYNVGKLRWYRDGQLIKEEKPDIPVSEEEKTAFNAGNNIPQIDSWLSGWASGEGSIAGNTNETQGETYDSFSDVPDPAVFGDEGFGATTLNASDFEGLDAEGISSKLLSSGFVLPGGMTKDDLEDEIRARFPSVEEIDAEELAYAQQGFKETAYGLEQDVLRAGDDYKLIEQRGTEDKERIQATLGLDLKDAGTAARSDIYGLQSQGAQQKRQGMFGKGLGGGMETLRASDISKGMQTTGRGRMQSLETTARGLREGAFDAQQTIDRGVADALTTRDRDISDAMVNLYGIEGQGGIYGQYGDMAKAEFTLKQEAEQDFETNFETFLSDLIKS